MSARPAVQTGRAVAAFAAVALLVASVPAVQGVVGAADAGGSRACGAPSVFGGETEEMRASLRDLVLGSDEARWPTGDVPAWLAEASRSARGAREVVSDAALGLTGFVLSGDAREVCAQLSCELRDSGWEASPGADGCQATLRREPSAQGDGPSWSSVACAQIGNEVSVVVCYR